MASNFFLFDSLISSWKYNNRNIIKELFLLKSLSLIDIRNHITRALIIIPEEFLQGTIALIGSKYVLKGMVIYLNKYYKSHPDVKSKVIYTKQVFQIIKG